MTDKHAEEREQRMCPCCDQQSDTVKNRRRNTSFVEESLNWLESCSECYERDYEYYAERWQEYYSSR